MSRLTPLDVERIVREARASGALRTDARDPGLPGLELRVGRRTVVWRLYYTDRRTHRKERVVLGRYPDVGLAEARRRAKAHQADIEDPDVRASPARELRDRSGSMKFSELAEARLAAKGNKALADSTLVYYSWAYKRWANPAFGDLPAGDVRAEDVVALLDKIERRGSLVTADRVRAAISSAYAWAMSRRSLASNPTAGLGRRSTAVSRERVLTDAELTLLLRGIEGSGVSADMRLALMLIIHTGQRSSEVREAEAFELRWDGVDARGARFPHPCWVIPGRRRVKGAATASRTK